MHDDDRLPGWGFAFPGRIRNELTALALTGVKTATAGLLVEYELEVAELPRPGERQLLLDSAEEPVAIVETTSCRVTRLADVDDDHARDEGEGYANAAEFRAAHERFWSGYLDDLRARARRPDLVLDDDTPVVLERFRVVERLDVPPPPATSRVVRIATPAEIPFLAGVLARAFRTDPMVRWPLISDDDVPRRIRATFEATDTLFAGEGWMHTVADSLGVMSLLPPGSAEREAALAAEMQPRIAALSPDGGARYERFWAWIWDQVPDEPHWMLDQLAVEPAAQGRGIGRALMNHAIGTATTDGLPLVLETGVKANLDVYRHIGFRVISDGDAPDDGPHIWFLRHDPRDRP
jgi:uncharacterized protein YhfF/GNAT superfamily N-acetyltransferase